MFSHPPAVRCPSSNVFPCLPTTRSAICKTMYSRAFAGLWLVKASKPRNSVLGRLSRSCLKRYLNEALVSFQSHACLLPFILRLTSLPPAPQTGLPPHRITMVARSTCWQYRGLRDTHDASQLDGRMSIGQNRL